MGYLKMVFDRYYESDDIEEKKRLRKGFSTRLWDSLPYVKSDRSFRFDVVATAVPDEEMRKLFIPHQRIKYKVLKSRYNINTLDKEDLVRARINSNYGKYFDKEVYLGKEYYKHMAHIRNIYFNYVDGKYTSNEEVIQEVHDTYSKAMKYKEEAESRKIDLSWEEYQQFIEKCLDRIFENYIPIEEHPTIEWEENDYWDWDEDNAVLGYVNTSLNGYLKNYINDSKKPKEKFCQECGVEIDVKSSAKYCKECAIMIKKEKHRLHQKKYIQNKQKKEENCKMAYVYTITNKINNNQYIGSTNDYKRRWYKHLWSLKTGQHHSNALQRAWDKYGEDNFEFSILEECEASMQFEREQFYIDTLQPFSPNGYNILKTVQTATNDNTGENHSLTTLTNEEVISIKKSLADGVSQTDIIKQTGLSWGVIGKIASVSRWVDVGSEYNEKLLALKRKTWHEDYIHYVLQCKEDGLSNEEIADIMGFHASTITEKIRAYKKKNNLYMCEDCATIITNPKPRQKYCDECKRVRDKERQKRYNAKRRSKA